MAATKVFVWHGLPAEMKLAVLENLTLHDVRACSRVDSQTYSSCLPILFRTVKLPSLELLQAFLKDVPRHYYGFIHDLDVCTKPALYDMQNLDAYIPSPSSANTRLLATLLSHCTSLESLTLSVGGSLIPNIILPVFKQLERVKRLKLENWEQEEVKPFSERLVVSLAFALPQLEDLALTRITRSVLHAPELRWSNIPVVNGDAHDDDIPPHALLGRELRLPQLLRLPHLQRLKIKDTHLGDPMWAGPVLNVNPAEDGYTQPDECCPLEMLDLGTCAYVSPQQNEAHTARILARMPSSIKAFSLSSSLPPTFGASTPSSPKTNSSAESASSAEAKPAVALPHLRTLHLTPLVPTSSIPSTLTQSTLASSPVHTLSCAFHPDDAAEGCAALEAFLCERRERGAPSSGRKRSNSKLSICENFSEEPESIGSPVATDKASSFEDLAVTYASAFSPLYPALRTLSIDVPTLASSPLTPTGKLSPRRLAAVRRREEERRNAARRLKALAWDLGLDVVMKGVDCGDEAAAHVGEVNTQVPSGIKFGLRSRSNST